jgi:hypothetical protein
VVETDASKVAKLWKNRTQKRSEIAAILHDIKEPSGNMNYFQLNFFGREASEGAHLCAKQASASRRRYLWIKFVPNCLQKDCNQINK